MGSLSCFSSLLLASWELIFLEGQLLIIASWNSSSGRLAFCCCFLRLAVSGRSASHCCFLGLHFLEGWLLIVASWDFIFLEGWLLIVAFWTCCFGRPASLLLYFHLLPCSFFPHHTRLHYKMLLIWRLDSAPEFIQDAVNGTGVSMQDALV